MRCQLHRFLRKTEDNTRHPINYCTSIMQENNKVGAEKYCTKIIRNSYYIEVSPKTELWFINFLLGSTYTE